MEHPKITRKQILFLDGFIFYYSYYFVYSRMVARVPAVLSVGQPFGSKSCFFPLQT